MADDLIYCAGEWLQRAEGHWRERIDLSTCDTVTAYAAGRHDGYELALVELRAFAEQVVAARFSAWIVDDELAEVTA